LEEKIQEEISKGYLHRSKKIGRIGPLKTELDIESVYGRLLFAGQDYNALITDPFEQIDKLMLDVEATSSFVSVRANTAVFKGCYYYEITLLCDGLAQVGWAQLQTPFEHANGVGDDRHSYAFDGHRKKKWNGGDEPYGE